MTCDTETYPLLSPRQPVAEPLPIDFRKLAEAIRQMERTARQVWPALATGVKRATDALRAFAVRSGLIAAGESVALLPGQLKHAFKPDFDLACTVHGCTRQPEQH